MLKISFKSEPDSPSKIVERVNNKVTLVTLKGVLKMPQDWWILLPKSVEDYILNHPTVKLAGIYDNASITVRGKAIKADRDTDNPVVAERIAESRAKIKLYRFMCIICKRLHDYFQNIIVGNVYNKDVHLDVKDNSIYGAYKKYELLHAKELTHLESLLRSV